MQPFPKPTKPGYSHERRGRHRIGTLYASENRRLQAGAPSIPENCPQTRRQLRQGARRQPYPGGGGKVLQTKE